MYFCCRYLHLIHLNGSNRSRRLIILSKISTTSSTNYFYPVAIAAFSNSTNLNRNHHHPAGKFLMEAPLISKTDVAESTGMKTKYKYGMAIALISTAVTVFAVNAGDSGNDLGDSGEFKMTPDAEMWYKKGVENANRDLDQFDDIASSMNSGSTDHNQLEVQLKLLQSVIVDVGNNNRQLIPKLVDLIKRINGFLEGDCPSIFSRAGLKALIWYVDGKRDNKSYYLLDGEQLWCELRVKILQKYKSNPTVQGFIQDLEQMQKETADLRDELDGVAQIFVKGIKKIHSMTGDIGGHLAELKQVASELLIVSEQSGKFLDNTKKLETAAQELVTKYK